MRISIVGSGSVAEAMAVALVAEGLDLVQVYGRNRERVREIAEIAGRADLAEGESLRVADLYILSVSDSAIEEVLEGLDFAEGAIVAHTAGSVSIDILGAYRGAVIYPLQSFTRGIRLAHREIPLFVEARDERTLSEVLKVANALSDRVVVLSSERRTELHLAAVFACNFTIAMMEAAHKILRNSNLDLSLYDSLIRETIRKATNPEVTPMSVQSGPAKRGDKATMNRHIEMLPRVISDGGESDKLIEIYKTISNYIWETSKKI